MNFFVEEELDYINVAEKIKREISQPSVIFLEGDLAAGKTTFVRHYMAPYSGVTSPTYSLVNSYPKGVLHADFYRLKSEKEIEDIGLPIYLESTQLFFCEWGLEYEQYLKDWVLEDNFDIYLIDFSITLEKKRKLTLSHIFKK